MRSQSKLQSPTFSLTRGCVALAEVLEWTLPDQQYLIGKFLARGSTGMLSGPRGLGKSLLTTTIAYGVAGGKWLRPWGCGVGAVVAYVDGEMSKRTLTTRVRQIRNRDTDPQTIALASQNLHIISRDVVGGVIGYIDNEDDQRLIESMLPKDCALLIIDNLSAWTSSGREDGASYAPIKRWLCHLRTKDIAVLLVHHTGKRGGDQRGSSIHEDLLDYSILLSPDKHPKPQNGTSFLLQHTKLRDLHPDLPDVCRIVITTENDIMHLAYEDMSNPVAERDAEIAALFAQGYSGKEIAQQLGLHPSTVSRAKARLDSHVQDEGASDED